MPISGATPGKKDPPLQLTPLERLLVDAGPIREDGSDKFFGMENVRISCSRATAEWQARH